MKTNEIKICMILLVFTIAISGVLAQQEGCCTLTKAGQPCADGMSLSDSSSLCEDGRFVSASACSQTAGCGIGTCQTFSGPCTEGGPESACNGVFHLGETKEQVDECKKVCTAVAGTGCEVKELKLAKEWATSHGYQLTDVEKDETISGASGEDQNQKCYMSLCSGGDMGCCYGFAESTSGGCTYGTRKACNSKSGSFALGTFCRDVMIAGARKCAVTSHKTQQCIEAAMDPTQSKICWKDSQDNIEECNEDCGYPNNMCAECREINCTDNVNTSKVVSIGQPYCKTRVCKFSLNGSEYVENNIIKWKSYTNPIILQPGESMCYNFFSAHSVNKAQNDIISSKLEGVSTGLSSQYLECQEATAPDPAIYSYGITRDVVCNDKIDKVGTVNFTNNWKDCRSCGETSLTLDWMGDAFSRSTILLSSLNDILGKRCTKEECESKGTCVYHEALSAYGNAKPVGSCDPIYAPGVENAAGNDRSSTSCEKCGAGWDSFWKPCREEECYSLGNCQFSKLGDNQKFLDFLLIGAGITWFERIDMIPFSSLGTALLVRAPTGCMGIPIPGYFGCLFPAYLRVMGTKYTNYVGWPFKILFGALGSAWDLLKCAFSYVPIINGWAKMTPGSGCTGLFSFLSVSQDYMKNFMDKYDANAKFIANYKPSEDPVLKSQYEKAQKFTTDKKDIYDGFKRDYKSTQTAQKEGVQQNTQAQATGKDPIDWVDTASWLLSIAWGISNANQVLGDASETKVGFCSPEPAAQDKCSECNSDPYRFCYKERCLALGANCHPLQDEKTLENNICYKSDCDNARISITKIQADWFAANINYDHSDTATGADYTEINADVPWNITTVRITATTNDFAECRWSDVPKSDFNDMNNFTTAKFTGTEYEVDVPFCKKQGNENVCYPYDSTQYIFIKCKNLCGLVHDKEYDQNFVKFKIGNKPDMIGSWMDRTDPPNNAWIPSTYGTLSISSWISENGAGASDLQLGSNKVCKFSDKTTNWTTEWDKMIWFQGDSKYGAINNYHDPESGIMRGSCSNNKRCYNNRGDDCARCNLTIDLSKGGMVMNVSGIQTSISDINCDQYSGDEKTNCENMHENIDLAVNSPMVNSAQKMYKFVFRCQDSLGNIGDPLEYSFLVATPYNITVNKPILNGRYYLKNLELDLNTSLPTNCKYSIGLPTDTKPTYDEKDNIDSAFSEIHNAQPSMISSTFSKQFGATFSQSTSARAYISCKSLGDMAITKIVDFTLDKDTQAPQAVRAYYEDNKIKVVTDEPATCRYSTTSCAFNFTASTNGLSSTANGLNHFVAWAPGTTYYVKCKDSIEPETPNYPSSTGSTTDPNANGCTTIIRPIKSA